MIPTFVIGLREGLEAALIVGIIAAFLKQQGRNDLMRWVLAGIAVAVSLCVAVGVALEVLSRDLPQRQQEGLETVIGAVAVVMVTYMVVWMKRHSRSLKGQLEGAAADAVANGSASALVLMAFLAVLREGFETAVFLIAAFNQSGSGASGPIGAVLGIAIAIAIGWGIYRGGVRLNLARFFRFTGAVLVLVAAGLVVTAFHTAHEAGWLQAGQQGTINLTSVVKPGSIQESLLTGMLGIQGRPVLIELIAWLVYLVPLGTYVLWPAGRAPQRATVARILTATGLVGVVAVVILVVARPTAPATAAATSSGGLSARVISTAANSAQLEVTVPGVGGAVSTERVTSQRSGAELRHSVNTTLYSVDVPAPAAPGALVTRLTYAQVADLNGGRLPLGSVSSTTAPSATATLAVSQSARAEALVWVEPRTGRVIDVQWTVSVSTTAEFPTGPTELSGATSTTEHLTAAAANAAARSARADLDRMNRRHDIGIAAVVVAVLTAISLILAALYAFSGRLHADSDATSSATGVTPTPRETLSRS